MNRLYPRPQLERKQWINLNGSWDFDFDDEGIGMRERWQESHDYSRKILVPFPYQAPLSGIGDVSRHDRVWYHTAFSLDRPASGLVILHFGAVDYRAEVFVNGKSVGIHRGGSVSFQFDITTHLRESGPQDLSLFVTDPSLDSFISRGKQTWREEPFECFYHRTTGIWQTVWLETVDEGALVSLKLTPDIDASRLRVELGCGDDSVKESLLEVAFEGKTVASHVFEMRDRGCLEMNILPEDLHLWSPESPRLYDVKIRLYREDRLLDEVDSYFGMRKISSEGGKILLNNRPYYLRLVLDQGYYPDGLLSYPSEEALLEDIRLAKAMGFNGCRKHEKIEAERFLYDADREGFLVTLEMPSAYSFRPSRDFAEEWLAAMERDYNHPSLFLYVPFNESWGIRKIRDEVDIQNYATAFYHLTKSFDPSRLVSTNDGWEQTITDICAIHSYRHGAPGDLLQHLAFQGSLWDREKLLSAVHTDNGKPLYVGGYHYRNEPILLSEFGGISFANRNQNGWGYTGVGEEKTFLKELERIFDVVWKSPHLAGFCYTQLTDVEQEINGFLDDHRNPKADLSQIREIVSGPLSRT